MPIQITVGAALKKASDFNALIDPGAPGAVEMIADQAAISNMFPREPICPDIPGIIFDEFPDLKKYGDILSTGIEKLIERVTAPPSGKNIVLELTSRASDIIMKKSTAIKMSFIALKEKVEAQLVAETKALKDAASNLENAVDAALSLKIIQETALYQMSADFVDTAFAGYKDVEACFFGEPGSAVELAKREPEELGSSSATGAGQNAALIINKGPGSIAREVAQNADKYEDHKLKSITEDRRLSEIADQERAAYLDPFGPLTPPKTLFDFAEQQRDVQWGLLRDGDPVEILSEALPDDLPDGLIRDADGIIINLDLDEIIPSIEELPFIRLEESQEIDAAIKRKGV